MSSYLTKKKDSSCLDTQASAFVDTVGFSKCWDGKIDVNRKKAAIRNKPMRAHLLSLLASAMHGLKQDP